MSFAGAASSPSTLPSTQLAALLLPPTLPPSPRPQTQPENCGATAGLLRCSRCRAARFCSPACHKSYWPVHRARCRPNDFADAAEASEPKFAAWMRVHGRMAVLKDDEVDRLERAARPGGYWGLGRAEVMDSMYGRADPAPAPPRFDARDAAAMRAARRAALEARKTQVALRGAAAVAAAVDADDGDANVGAAAATSDPGALRAAAGAAGFEAVVVPPGLGLAVSSRLKWRQSQSHVEVFVRLPDALALRAAAGRSVKSRVAVRIEPASLHVALAGGADVVAAGPLFARVKAEASTWVIGAFWGDRGSSRRTAVCSVRSACAFV